MTNTGGKPEGNEEDDLGEEVLKFLREERRRIARGEPPIPRKNSSLEEMSLSIARFKEKVPSKIQEYGKYALAAVSPVAFAVYATRDKSSGVLLSSLFAASTFTTFATLITNNSNYPVTTVYDSHTLSITHTPDDGFDKDLTIGDLFYIVPATFTSIPFYKSLFFNDDVPQTQTHGEVRTKDGNDNVRCMFTIDGLMYRDDLDEKINFDEVRVGKQVINIARDWSRYSNDCRQAIAADKYIHSTPFN
jgi:hypothetical protein